MENTVVMGLLENVEIMARKDRTIQLEKLTQQVKMLEEELNIQVKTGLRRLDHIDYLQKLIVSLGGNDDYHQEDGRGDEFNDEQALNKYHKEQEEMARRDERIRLSNIF